MKNLTKIALGVLTSIGGFLEAGSLGTALEAGASFRYELLWCIALGTICVAFLTEMTGRLAAVSHHTVVDAIRKRFGFALQVYPFGAQIVLNLLVLASEVGGAAFALQLVSGVSMRLWAVPIAGGIWLTLWKGRFGKIENTMALLGMVTVAFVVAAWKLGPDWPAVGAGLVPGRPDHDAAHYAFLAVSILGASISPYLLTFYSSGAVEEEWNEADVLPNRIVAGAGMSTGSIIAMAALVTSALVLAPRGVKVESFDQARDMLVPAFGRAGTWLFAAALFIGCVGAAFEIALDLGYVVAQTFGWDWSENRHEWTETRFSLTYSVGLALAVIPTLAGIDPFTLTIFTMAITALALPLVIGPLLVVMNDERYLKKHTNGIVANVVVLLIIGLAFVLALVALPLQWFGGS